MEVLARHDKKRRVEFGRGDGDRQVVHVAVAAGDDSAGTAYSCLEQGLGLGSVACECLTALVLNQHGNAITLSANLWKRGVRDGRTLREEIIRSRREKMFTFGVVFPFSSHRHLFRKWLSASGIDPERDVRFVQLFHRGWDQHIAIAKQLPNQCKDVDQPTAALIKDLRQRGLLEDTLVVFATEFGRTVFSQGKLGDPGMGRDHHGRCFSLWLAGGGIKPGMVFGETDDYCYNIVENPVHIHDFNATLLHCLGIDHTRLTHRFQGRDFRLTDIHGELVKPILA